ncbi:MAG: hypothetical protein H0W65_11680 [Sphingomonas sp.]|uniref:phage tail protein n=1 Tax=Sphingomonas sp. TaxID=28214 RepID=UPI0018302661|nr:phage tail protein [Sphingomonas sp.]MBA3668358.1 hypothetical protein [Sphingomonas sp.]
MATLVLTAVGTALGGPLGGALGSLVGQTIDQQLLGPGPRKGPRLGDLSVQTSSYGSQIPRLYGTMRVAGTVVWATDLKEEEAIEGGGKGSPEAIAYRYSASLAVALSSRPIIRVKRIWADGKLIRGAAGDFKVRTDFRLVAGDEDQPVDPLIASIETIDQSTAFRGLALAIFENFELAEFGNRIPLLTFEVEADAGEVPLAYLLADASAGLIEASDDQAVAGYAAHGRSIADAIAPLVDLNGIELREEMGKLRSPSGSPAEIAGDELGCGTEGKSVPPTQRARASSADMPTSLALTYYDPTRDYQAGQMRAASGAGGVRDERIEYPAVLEAEGAKLLAENALSRRWASGDQLTISLPPARIGMKPGDRLRLSGSTFIWAARRVTVEAMRTTVEAEPAPRVTVGLPADPGRPVSEADATIGPTELRLIEPPALGDDIEAAIRVYIAGSNVGAWKAVPVETRIGAEPLAPLSLPRKAVIGRAGAALDGGSALLLDLKGEVAIQLSDPAQRLRNADDQALMSGANLAMLGDELIQFGRADDLGGGAYRLSRLLRGRRGTEWSCDHHGSGEAFCLIDPATLRPIDLARSSADAVIGAVAHGLSDASPWPSAQRLLSGEAMRPLSPCHVQTRRAEAGLHVAWTRRSHRGWAWLDTVEVAPDGFAELYRLTIRGPAGTRSFETGSGSMLIAWANVPAAAGQVLGVSVVRVGPFAASRETVLTLII